MSRSHCKCSFPCRHLSLSLQTALLLMVLHTLQVFLHFSMTTEGGSYPENCSKQLYPSHASQPAFRTFESCQSLSSSQVAMTRGVSGTRKRNTDLLSELTMLKCQAPKPVDILRKNRMTHRAREGDVLRRIRGRVAELFWEANAGGWLEECCRAGKWQQWKGGPFQDSVGGMLRC